MAVAYETKKKKELERGLEKSRTGRDIAGDYPKPGDLVTRSACERDFKVFCETYFPNAFNMAWSEDHLKVIARMQEIILEGGLFALAMPRGGGKTTLSVRAALWALLYGHRRFVCLIAATEKLAEILLKSLKTELVFNERLMADFRQVCYPLVRLENNGRKSIGQLFDGEQTRIDWSEDRLTFPTVPDKVCDGLNVSGSTVTVAGLTGAIRGQSHTLQNGVIIRPEVVILDDPQTRESAMSISQSKSRAAIIQGDVLGMAGPNQRIAGIMPCTVVRSGDMADVMLDRTKNPEWSGQLTKMVYSFPKNEKLWEEYGRLWSDGLQAGLGIQEATDFYAQHREAMDEGSRVAWSERFLSNELSALQCAMNLKLRDQRSFFAEYQNQPLPEEDIRGDDLTVDQIMAKINRLPRGIAPIATNYVTSFVDVQGSLLFYVVVAWDDAFSGHILDYGTYPDQKRAYFTLRDAKIKLENVVKAAGLEGHIYGGLEALTKKLIDREWARDDGAGLKMDRLLIDANWGASTNTVFDFCRKSSHSSILTPSHGKYFGAASVPMREYIKQPGDKVGLNWRLPNVKGRREVRYVVYDTNFWKGFIHTRFATAMGDKGCLSIFGDDPKRHEMFADQICSEYRVRTMGRGREVDEFKLRPDRPDNHFLDCLTGCAVAASMQGCVLAESGAAVQPKVKRVSFAELRARRGAQPSP